MKKTENKETDNKMDAKAFKKALDALVKEKDILSWRNNNHLTFLNCACKFTERNDIDREGTSKRKEIKELIDNLRQINKEVDHNIFKSLDNINLNCVLGVKKDGKYASFLEEYDR